MSRWWWLLPAILVGVGVLDADDPKPLSVRDRAIAAWRARNYTNAIALASEAISAEPKDPRLWNFRAQMRAILGDSGGAIADFGEALRLAPDSATLHQERAIVQFKAGRIPESLEDFDRANTLDPQRAAQNWQRGLALYYARRYADGRKQFELHRSVNPNDVENAVWHFACVARLEGLEAARAALMEIRGDSRIPMAEVHDLFAGEAEVEDVLETARAEEAGTPARAMAEFYAWLYLGLYHDLHGRHDAALNSLREAVKFAQPGDYMGDVARIHLQLLEKSPAPAAPSTNAPSAPKLTTP
ncbi:MAG: tetratricopeptide repeat protein [Verrucomicrobia bacterium]|nr:tetratricopeptide repeat protein [Verrucomicrobiota bacterium]